MYYYRKEGETPKEYIDRIKGGIERRKDKVKENRRLWGEKNKEWIAEYEKNRRATKKRTAYVLSKTYINNDTERGYDTTNNITPQWIEENLFSDGSKCIYCGDNNWKHLGADRIDNTKPHTPDNVVCSCDLCNVKRGKRYTVEEFKKYRALHPREHGIVYRGQFYE